jgi:hypothetical protein
VATSSGSARVQKKSSTTATSTSSAPQPPPPPVPARASGSAGAANQAVQRAPAVQPVAVADAVDHFVNLDDAAAWHQFRPLLATFIGDMVANRDGKYEVARFNNMPAARAEYASTLARISGGGGGGQFVTFVYETAVTKNRAAYVPFAARFMRRCTSRRTSTFSARSSTGVCAPWRARMASGSPRLVWNRRDCRFGSVPFRGAFLASVPVRFGSVPLQRESESQLKLQCFGVSFGEDFSRGDLAPC